MVFAVFSYFGGFQGRVPSFVDGAAVMWRGCAHAIERVVPKMAMEDLLGVVY